MEFILSYNYKIEYRKGSHLSETWMVIYLLIVATATTKDSVLIKVKEFCLKGWPQKVSDEVSKS